MRTTEEIEALRVAAGIYCGFDGVNCIAWKGEPATMISVEPMMTISLETVAPDGVRDKASQRAPVIGPITRMAMSLHLGLSADEAEAMEMTAAAAERDLLAYMDACMRTIVPKMKEGAVYPSDSYPAVDESCTIQPSDPRWLEAQRAAMPFPVDEMPPVGAARRG